MEAIMKSIFKLSLLIISFSLYGAKLPCKKCTATFTSDEAFNLHTLYHETKERREKWAREIAAIRARNIPLSQNHKNNKEPKKVRNPKRKDISDDLNPRANVDKPQEAPLKKSRSEAQHQKATRIKETFIDFEDQDWFIEPFTDELLSPFSSNLNQNK
jgi:hypothetical protein